MILHGYGSLVKLPSCPLRIGLYATSAQGEADELQP
jgi:hypothetical protein